MPSEFAKSGIRFQYPDDWTLTEDVSLPDCKSVTVISPEGAFWAVSIHPQTTNPTQLAEAASKALREEYQELEMEAVEEEIGEHHLIGRDFNFYYLDLTNTATVRCVQSRRATYAFFAQAEDREFARVGEVFKAMTTSFLNHVRIDNGEFY